MEVGTENLEKIEFYYESVAVYNNHYVRMSVIACFLASKLIILSFCTSALLLSCLVFLAEKIVVVFVVVHNVYCWLGTWCATWCPRCRAATPSPSSTSGTLSIRDGNHLTVNALASGGGGWRGR